ncbi:hypothetical protein PV327_010228 [Microctonus hyperodae]|uniref:Uncharacterized protein n=1 Tax=Microctonus hyperodae TaxID=165561 RepID=A0AA39KUU5_MICHY|nr:hypothetical protein PV327_010228 [Microctonus hyperodae]
MIFEDLLNFVVILTIFVTTTQAIYSVPESVDRDSITNFDFILPKKTIANSGVFNRDELESTDYVTFNDKLRMIFPEWESTINKKEHDTETNIDSLFNNDSVGSGNLTDFDSFVLPEKTLGPTIDDSKEFKPDEPEFDILFQKKVDELKMMISKIKSEINMNKHDTETNVDFFGRDSVDRSSLTNFDVFDFDKKTFEPTIDNSELFKRNEQPELTDNKEINDDTRKTFFGFDSDANEKEHDTEKNENDNDSGTDNQSPLDPWSIVWYIGSFGGLVAFFLIVSCSEWCCRRSARPSTPYNPQRSVETTNTPRGVTETPPPPYHLFAPPSYDSVNYIDLVDKTSGEKMDIFVISVPVQPTAPPQHVPV